MLLVSPDGIDARMSEFVWRYPERRDLFLACRILADGVHDGDWLQWASDTLLKDLELFDDPLQGVASWVFEDEADLAKEVGEKLWTLVRDNPFTATDQLTSAEATSLKQAAERLVRLMQANGR